MMNAMLNLFFGCRHKHFTRPITPLRKLGDHRQETYVSCLECGKQYHYDLENMRMGTAIVPTLPVEPSYGSFQAH